MNNYFILLILVGIVGCDSMHPTIPKTEIGHTIYVDYNTEQTINPSDLVDNVKFIPLDSNELIREGGVIKRVLINGNRIAILQSGAACGCSQFILFDFHGDHIKTVDGYHKGNDGFPWAMDMTFDEAINRYVIISRNPGRIIEIDTNGTVFQDKLLPYDGVYMDLYYFDDKYLFFSDNAILALFNYNESSIQRYLTQASAGKGFK